MVKRVLNVLILSAAASAVNFIKTLAHDPAIKLHVTDADPYCPGLYHPRVHAAWLPQARDTQSYRTALDHLLEGRDIDVLIPTSDYDVEGVARYLHDGWEPSARLFRPPWSAFLRLSHKGRLFAHLNESVPDLIPRTWSSFEAAKGAPCPVVVKPVAESGGKGVTVVQQSAALPAALERARTLYGDDFVVQEFIPGRTWVATLVYDQSGACIVVLTMRSQLTFFTWGGGGCAGELAESPMLEQLSQAVISACGGWCGPINFEWRQHSETGRFYLMEANCRLNGYSYLTTMNGVLLPRIALNLLTGDPLPPLRPQNLDRRRNFVIGYRERLVDRWVERNGQ